MSQKPNFYAIIPATVRYDKRISSSAKLLFAEISSLCCQQGYCWATNKYFSELYEVEERTIERWIAELRKFGHIKTEVTKKRVKNNEGKCVFSCSRKIRIPTLNFSDSIVEKKKTPPDKNVAPETDKNVGYNTKPINIKKNNNKEKKEAAPSETAVVVFSCLNNLKISEAKKKAISKKMSEADAELMVKYTLAWKERTSDLLAVNFFSDPKNLKDWDGSTHLKQEQKTIERAKEDEIQARIDNNKQKAFKLKNSESNAFQWADNCIWVKGYGPIGYSEEICSKFLEIWEKEPLQH